MASEVRNIIGGTRVQGKAKIGDQVSYFDMANQNCPILQVVSLPEDNIDPEWGWTSGYGLVDPVTGEESFSDLRQYGWTFA